MGVGSAVQKEDIGVNRLNHNLIWIIQNLIQLKQKSENKPPLLHCLAELWLQGLRLWILAMGFFFYYYYF
ncbi:hypothetical protein GRJ2_001372700 [Grus japonensis]|uniref:Uncharacterized protein n=1 Tax=Grus japonensis TaxID=30415 RepID=A0ABC9WUE9_GRUJA